MNPRFGVSIKGYIYGPTSIFFVGKYSIYFRMGFILFVIAVLLFSEFLILGKPKVQTKYHYIRLSIGNLLISLMDLLITFVNTPNLAKEGNILVTKFGLGWNTLIFADFIAFIMVLICTRYFCRYKHVMLSAENTYDYYTKRLSLNDDHFVSHFLLPQFSYIYYWVLTIVSPIPVINWILIMLTSHPWWNDYWIIAIICPATHLSAAYKFIRNGYRESCRYFSVTSQDKTENS